MRAVWREPDLIHVFPDACQTAKAAMGTAFLGKSLERNRTVANAWVGAALLIDNPQLNSYATTVLQNEFEKVGARARRTADVRESKWERRWFAPKSTRSGRRVATQVRRRLHPTKTDFLTMYYHAQVYLRFIHNLDGDGLGTLVRSELAGRRLGARREDVYKDWWDRMQPFKAALSRRDLPPSEHDGCLEAAWY